MKRHRVKQLDFAKVHNTPLIGRVICGECGSAFGRKTWNSTEKWKAEDGDELKRYKAKEFIEIAEKSQGIEEFDVDLYFIMVEKMTVLGDEKVVVSFLDGTEVECVVE